MPKRAIKVYKKEVSEVRCFKANVNYVVSVRIGDSEHDFHIPIVNCPNNFLERTKSWKRVHIFKYGHHGAQKLWLIDDGNAENAIILENGIHPDGCEFY